MINKFLTRFARILFSYFPGVTEGQLKRELRSITQELVPLIAGTVKDPLTVSELETVLAKTLPQAPKAKTWSVAVVNTSKTSLTGTLNALENGGSVVYAIVFRGVNESLMGQYTIISYKTAT